MSLLLKLDSSTALSVISGEDQTDDFTIEFPSPINLAGSPYEMALIKLNLWYSWYNISSVKGNNILRYHNGALFRPNIIIPDGQYTLDQLNDLLHDEMKANGDFTVSAFGVDEYDIEITPNFATLRTNILITGVPSYQLDLTVSTLNLLLGWTSIIVTDANDGDGQNVANINDDINSIIAHCDVIAGNGSYSNSVKSDVLHSFVPNSIPGTNIDVDPQHKIYLPLNVRENQVSSIRVRITDNLDRRLDFNNEPVTWLLHIRRAAKVLPDASTGTFTKNVGA